MPPRCAPACHPARSGRCGDSINWDYSTGCRFVPPPNWPRLWARRRNGCCTALVQRKRPIPVHWKLPSQFRRKFPSKFLRKLLSGLFRKLTRKLLKLPSKFCGQLTSCLLEKLPGSLRGKLRNALTGTQRHRSACGSPAAWRPASGSSRLRATSGRSSPRSRWIRAIRPSTNPPSRCATPQLIGWHVRAII